MLDIFSLLSSDSLSLSSSDSSSKKSLQWFNKTSGNSNCFPSVSSVSSCSRKVISRKKKIASRDFRCSYSLSRFDREELFHSVLSSASCLLRSERISILVHLFSANKSACLIASLNDLQRWIHCYKRKENRRIVSRLSK